MAKDNDCFRVWEVNENMYASLPGSSGYLTDINFLSIPQSSKSIPQNTIL